MDACIFCAIVAGEAESFVVASDDKAVAFLDINPLSRGHSLVVPVRHVSDLLGWRPRAPSKESRCRRVNVSL